MNKNSSKKNIDNSKANNFKSSILRLFKELKSFKVLIYISIILASFASILSIIAPNKLSDLTDEISSGLVINKDNMKKLSENFNNKDNNLLLGEIFKIDITKDKINRILIDTNISNKDKELFNTFINNISTDNKDNILEQFIKLPSSILNILLEDSIYNDINITKNDKLELIDYLVNRSNVFPNKIKNLMFKNITIDNVSLSIDDQIEFITGIKNLNKDDKINSLYEEIEKMPTSIKKVIEPKINFNRVKKLSIFLVCLFLISAIFNFVEALIMTDVSNNFARKLRKRISEKINRLPLKYFDNHAIGDVLSRVTNDITTIAQSLSDTLSGFVSAICLLIGTVVMMFVTNWVMALTAIIASLVGFIFMFGILSKSQKYFVQKQEQLGKMNGHIEEIYSGLEVVKVYNAKKQVNKEFDNLNNKMYEANRKSQFLSGLMMPMMNFVGNFGYVAVCIVGALLTFNGYTSFGVIVAFIAYVRLFSSPLSQIAQSMSALQITAAASERVFTFLDEEELKSQEKVKGFLDVNTVEGNIEFKNVSFTYDGNDNPTINNFSAKVSKGQKIAIVGPTGAGKTTMVNLLMKFYDITKGDITIDGISTSNLTRENIHSLFTMVLQDTWLFEGTVKENIIYNRKNISDDRVKEVCNIVGLDHFIKTLPNGYDTILKDNDSVSSGQRQLLTIARGMLDDSPLLILDEATSNVDTRTEELVQKAMDKLTENKTSFIIAHRLSTIKNADLILVMKDGNIIETGNHNELLNKKGFYADLYNSQFEH